MKNKKFCGHCVLVILIFANGILGNEETPSTNDTVKSSLISHFDENAEQVFSSSEISEKVPDPIGMPQPNEPKPHHHQKQKNPDIDSIQSHTRSPVYEVISKPCYTPGCSGGAYGPQSGFVGNRWQPGRNRYGPHPRFVDQRRRGGYRDYIPPPPPGYGQGYGQQYPDYGYGPRAVPSYPPERFDRMGGYGGYGRPAYDDYFLG